MIPDLKIALFTSDSRDWLLKGFAHQWQKYAPIFWPTVDVYGFSQPSFPLASCLRFNSLGAFRDYPIEAWSNAVMSALRSMKEPFVMLLLEDYWLIRDVNELAIEYAMMIMRKRKQFVRFDITTDRMYETSSKDIFSVGNIDIIQGAPDAAYNFSYQASIWNREKLLDLMVEGETPWQSEINGNARLAESGGIVLGTRQWPMKYLVVVNKGQFDKTGNWMVPARTLYPEDWRELDEQGFTHA